jgi:hypothetical protein
VEVFHPITGATEEYNGATWTAGGSLNTARVNPGGAGIQTAALGFGGNTGPALIHYKATEQYDGTSWTTLPGTLATARDTGKYGPVGTQSSALYFGGYTGTVYTAATEEWNGAGSPTTVTITAS